MWLAAQPAPNPSPCRPFGRSRRSAPPTMQLEPVEGSPTVSPSPSQVQQGGTTALSQPLPRPRARAPCGLTSASTIFIPGGGMRTISYQTPALDQVHVELSSRQGPLDSDIEVWRGPDWTPCKIRVFIEDGKLRPFNAVIKTPRGPSTLAIRNLAGMEHPIAANVFTEDAPEPSAECTSSYTTMSGGAVRMLPFEPSVQSVEVLLKTDGRPLNARIELFQGSTSNLKKVIELYSEDGRERLFYSILRTPGPGHIIRIINTAHPEYVMSASVVPHSYDESDGEEDAPPLPSLPAVKPALGSGHEGPSNVGWLDRLSKHIFR
eukprot:scaffold93653_cov27-Tisochrysis_lutea.AAC.1